MIVGSSPKSVSYKKVQNEYANGCPKWQLTQIWLLEILGVKTKFWLFAILATCRKHIV
jgi:hypothetical protein